MARALIHIHEGRPEAGWWSVVFALSEGRFSDATLQAVRKATNGLGVFDTNNPGRLVVVYRYHPRHRRRPALAAVKVLRAHYPDARFTTASPETKEAFDPDVELVFPGG